MIREQSGEPFHDRLLEAVLWAVAATLLMFLDGAIAEFQTSAFLGGIDLLFGVRAFMGHGGGRITTLGLFNFACALFIGFAGIWEGINPSGEAAPIFIATGIYVAFLTQLAVTALAWRTGQTAVQVGFPTHHDAAWATTAGFIGMVAIFVAQEFALPFATSIYADGVAFTSVVLVTVGLLFRTDTRLLSIRCATILLVLAAYAVFFHQGTGRLRIVALACAIAMLATARFPARWIKVFTVTLTPAAIAWLAYDRLEFQESLHAGASAGNTGLESMLSPIWVLGRIIEAQWTEGWPLAWGRTFVTIPFSFLPDSQVPTWAPEALGYDLVHLTDPARAGTGFSMASTAYGEWIWNFSVVGLIAAVPFMAWAFKALDARFERILARLNEGRRPLLWLAAWGMASGGVADLAWSGVHTYLSRMLLRLPYLFVLVALSRPGNGGLGGAVAPRGDDARVAAPHNGGDLRTPWAHDPS